MNRYELKITDNKTKKSHTISSPRYTTLVEAFFETSAKVFNAITNKSSYTIYVLINGIKHVATYFPRLGGVCILHSIVGKIVSPYKLVLRDKTVAASTYDMGAICFYKKYTAVIAAIRNNIYGETRYSVYLVEKNMVFDNISKKICDRTNTIV